MIEINLLPGGGRKQPKRAKGKSAKAPAGKRAGFKLPKLSLRGALPKVDRMLGFLVVSWIGAPLALAWMILSVSNDRAELGLAIEKAQQDSARYAAIIDRMNKLQARRDTIAQKLEIIQAIDAGRYIWAHVLEEISRALPSYTWLVGLTPAESETPNLPGFQLTGRTANNFALTEFLTQLEASPFIRNVQLITTERTTEGEATVYAFTLQATYEDPAADVIETVPLFVGEDADGIASE